MNNSQDILKVVEFKDKKIFEESITYNIRHCCDMIIVIYNGKYLDLGTVRIVL